MFKKLGMMLLAACFLLPLQASAAEQTGVYVAPKFALNVQHGKGVLSFMGESAGDSKTGTRAGGALAIGYDFSKQFDLPVRAEIEYGAYGNLSKTIDYAEEGFSASEKYTIGVQTLLANVYWDITNYHGFTPYVGAGIGMAFVKTKSETSINYQPLPELSLDFSETKTVFAGQVGLGCSYAFNDYISADIGYRFLMMGDGEANGPYGLQAKSKDLYAHQFMLGLRVTF